MPKIVTVEKEGMSAELMEALFDQIGDRAFPRSAQTGKPQKSASMATVWGCQTT
jgi:hypothetical protein